MSLRAHFSHEDRGSGSILVLGVASACLSLAMLVVGAGAASVAQARAAAAADAGALAAADALSGFASGEPCVLADQVVRASGAALAGCELSGLDVRVTTSVPLGSLSATARARAGPPLAAP